MLPDIELLTFNYAVLEAKRNVPTSRHADLKSLLQSMAIVADPPLDTSALPASLVLPVKDAPIFLAAAAAGATHLLGGDKRHFGPYFGKQIEGVLILTPRGYFQSRDLVS